MLFRKSRLLLTICIGLNFAVVNSVYAIDFAVAIEKGVQDIITYLTSATTIKNQADAEMIFMAPPGTNEEAQNIGISAAAVEAAKGSTLLEKELADLNWGLYLTPRQGEQIKGVAENNFLDKHTAFFCSPSSGVEQALKEPLCSNNTMEREHADIKISSLLGPVKYDSSRKLLAEEVIRTLSMPFPSTELKKLVEGGLNKLSDKKRAAALLAQQSAITVARNSLNEIYGARLPVTVDSVTPATVTSIMSIMENESGRRFKNKDWYDVVQQSSNEALLREMAHMEGFRLWMDYYRYKQSERIESLLAVMITQVANQMTQVDATMSLGK